ncbi:MAG TPA: dinitrogenase iron-molybdenum cofactor biosynthesis protein [Firmicutes bacterium]|nr:dinitrogenase iron-molybdenum cofactor biosynthesis protein [Bacillota bacterium]
MKIAIPAEEQVKTGKVSPVFGRASYFFIYNEEDQTHSFKENGAKQRPGGAGVQASQLLVDEEVKVVITPQCGENALSILKRAGIKIYRSQDGSLQDNLDAYLQEKLVELTGSGQ